jgi:hypothetical protein
MNDSIRSRKAILYQQRLDRLKRGPEGPISEMMIEELPIAREQTPIHTSSTGLPFLPSTQGLKITEERMGKVVKSMFGKDVLNEWSKPSRDIYEGSNPTTQCNNTIGEATKDTPCWICGIHVDVTGTMEGMSPICDHVLPIAQAVFFLGLYSTRKIQPSEDMPSISNTIYKLEYEWSHHICNAEKSNILLLQETIDPVTNTPVWSPDTNAIRSVLARIQATEREGSATLKELISKTPDWFKKRVNEISLRVKTITDFINRPAEPGLGNLTELAGWASLVDPTSMTDAFLDKIKVSLPPNVTSRKRRTLSEGDRPISPHLSKKRRTMSASGRHRKRNRKTRRNPK